MHDHEFGGMARVVAGATHCESVERTNRNPLVVRLKLKINAPSIARGLPRLNDRLESDRT